MSTNDVTNTIIVTVLKQGSGTQATEEWGDTQ